MGDSSSLSSRFEYLELNCDSRGSSVSAGGTAATTWPMFFFNNHSFNPAGIKVLEAEVPFVFDTISQKNNTFIVNWGAGDTVITLTPGTYDAEELRVEIQTRLNAAAAGWNVTYNPFNFKYTITYTGSWTLNFASKNTPAINMGFGLGTLSSTANAITSANAASASGPLYLYVNSRTIGPGIRNMTQDEDVNINQICRIPINVQKGSVIFYKDSNPNQYFDFLPGYQFNNFDLFLSLGFDQSEYPLEMKGLGFSVKLGILNYRPAGIPIGQTRADGRGGRSFLNG